MGDLVFWLDRHKSWGIHYSARSQTEVDRCRSSRGDVGEQELEKMLTSGEDDEGEGGGVGGAGAGAGVGGGGGGAGGGGVSV
jgi:hypothetical protein